MGKDRVLALRAEGSVGGGHRELGKGGQGKGAQSMGDMGGAQARRFDVDMMRRLVEVVEESCEAAQVSPPSARRVWLCT